MLFPWSHVPCLALVIFLPPLWIAPEPCVGRSLIKTFLFSTEYYNVSLSTHFPVVNSHLLQEAYFVGLSDALIYGYNHMSLGIILLMCLFSRVIVVRFPLGPMTYLVLGSYQ